MGIKKPKVHSFLKGFTVIELVIVISIIAILAGITIVGYNGWKNTALAAQVKSDLNGEAAAMESYRTFNNAYPTALSSITSFTPSTNDTLTLSSDSTATNYCIDAYNTNNPSTTFYLASETKDQGALSGTCATRPGSSGTPATPTGLAATSISSSEIDLSWTAISGTGVTYTIQRATDSAFVYVVGEITQSGTTRASTGLSPNTTYFYRVEATTTGGTSSWSNTASSNTLTAGPSGLAAVVASTTQINYSWTALGGAASYNVQADTDPSFVSPTPITHSQTGITGSFTGLSPSTKYYFRVQGVNGGGLATGYSSSVTTATYTDWSAYTLLASVERRW
jgi:prepilin-type N-terminal cleavage/methylation domain-containing protein